MRPRLSSILSACTLLLLAGSAGAGPRIDNLSLRGLRTGATTTLTIDGADLLPAPRLILPVPIAAQTVRPGATPNRVQIDVTLTADVPPGLVRLRLANPLGISNAVTVGLDGLIQQPFTDRLDQLPAALHGTLPGSTMARTTFASKKGQRLVVEIEARRLGAAIDPLIALLDPRGVQVAWSPGKQALSGDARLETLLPVDGTYAVEVRDALYQAGNPNHFRLKIGELYYADAAFPLGVQRGVKSAVTFLGNLPLGLQGFVEGPAVGTTIPVPLPALSALSGPAPRLFVGDFPEVVETVQPAGKLQEVAVPAAISGRVAKPHEEDRYRLLVQPGMSLRFDVTANRAGSPLDGVLTLRNEAGGQLAASEDRIDTVDPGFEFTVPDGVKAVVVSLTDLHGRGGAEFFYRLAVTPVGQPDFSLTVFEERQNLPQAGSAVLRVRANRAGYSGPIKLSVPGLTAGITVAGETIPADTTDTLLSLTAPAGTNLVQWVTQIVGESADPKTPLRRVAQLPETAETRGQPWQRNELALAVTGPARLGVVWDAAEPTLLIGTSYTAKMRLTRAAGVTGAVRLSLLTSQIVPKTKDNRADDVSRALRLQGTPMIAANQAEGTATVLVPADLPPTTYDLAVRAELLAADNATVLAAAVTPSRRLKAVPAFTVQVAKAAVEAKAGEGPTGKLAGKVVRAGDFKRPVTVTLTGLPTGLTAPSVQVPGDKSDFELPVAFPHNTKPGALPNVKLVATSTEAGQPTLRSNEIAVAITVVPGTPPAPQKK